MPIFCPFCGEKCLFKGDYCASCGKAFSMSAMSAELLPKRANPDLTTDGLEGRGGDADVGVLPVLPLASHPTSSVECAPVRNHQDAPPPSVDSDESRLAGGVSEVVSDRKSSFDLNQGSVGQHVQSRVGSVQATAVVQSERRTWLRWIARQLDLYWLMIFTSFFYGLLGHLLGQPEIFKYVGIQILLTFWLLVPIETIWIRLAGTTPGKWLFGIKISDASGHRLSWRRAWSRSARVLAHAYWFVIVPFGPLIGHLKAYSDLSTRGATRWDQLAQSNVAHGPLRKASLTLVISIMLALQVLGTTYEDEAAQKEKISTEMDNLGSEIKNLSADATAFFGMASSFESPAQLRAAAAKSVRANETWTDRLQRFESLVGKRLEHRLVLAIERRRLEKLQLATRLRRQVVECQHQVLSGYRDWDPKKESGDAVDARLNLLLRRCNAEQEPVNRLLSESND